jgi:hypothetical protein
MNRIPLLSPSMLSAGWSENPVTGEVRPPPHWWRDGAYFAPNNQPIAPGWDVAMSGRLILLKP